MAIPQNSGDFLSGGSDSSKEVTEVMDGDATAINRLYEELLTKTSEYLKSEFEGTAEDYRLIQQLNLVSKEKYEELLVVAKRFRESLGTMNDRFTCILPFLERIDAVESQVNELERSVFRLDTYAKQLETRFKALEKR
ncbi:biogenesis of lysosome-related organelles complex 1 subunit 2-like isoform X2 [Paramacrobiotus metropolitanus]|uniref:biogenesis of lysosome-related organelles complex 1 subunit 2-like isoform X2 n=1 Tax=Paramacrobiotus metropolitanus TaxID=2943436 RepID=UPI002445DD6E|nr:biogenesis of lysosome-related organelles complex 1 subunit 2-like isoform X2 [Paramacrobiotus metropolitanus]